MAIESHSGYVYPMKIITILMIFSLNAICCKASLSKMSKLNAVRLTEALNAKGFTVVESKTQPDIHVSLVKKSYFNIYGHPYFFMRELNLEVNFDSVQIFSAFSSDGFPVYKAFSEILAKLKDAPFRCVNSVVIR